MTRSNIFKAVEEDDYYLVVKYLARRADPNIYAEVQSGDNLAEKVPLHVAKSPQVVAALIAAGADVEEVILSDIYSDEYRGKTAMYVAVNRCLICKGNVDIVGVLLQAGAENTVKDDIAAIKKICPEYVDSKIDKKLTEISQYEDDKRNEAFQGYLDSAKKEIDNYPPDIIRKYIDIVNDDNVKLVKPVAVRGVKGPKDNSMLFAAYLGGAFLLLLLRAKFQHRGEFGFLGRGL